MNGTELANFWNEQVPDKFKHYIGSDFDQVSFCLGWHAACPDCRNPSYLRCPAIGTSRGNMKQHQDGHL